MNPFESMRIGKWYKISNSLCIYRYNQDERWYHYTCCSSVNDVFMEIQAIYNGHFSTDTNEALLAFRFYQKELAPWLLAWKYLFIAQDQRLMLSSPYPEK